MKAIFLCLFTVFCLISAASIEAKQKMKPAIKFFLWSTQLDPLISTEVPQQNVTNMDSFEGIIADVVKTFEKHENIDVQVHIRARLRGERELYENEHDFSILSAKWLQRPEELIYSDSIYVHREFLYSLSPFTTSDLATAIINKKICARSGYRFDTMQPFFNSGYAKRVNAKEEVIAFELMRRNRCDFVLTNEFVADSIIHENFQYEAVYRSEFLIDSTDFAFSFHPSKSEIRNKMNLVIEQLKSNGQLAQSISYHRSKLSEKHEYTRQQNASDFPTD